MKKTVLLALAALFAMLVQAKKPEKYNKDKNSLYYSSIPSPVFGEQSNSFLYPVWGYYISASGGMSKFKGVDKEITNNVTWIQSDGIGMSFNVGIFKALSPRLKLITGLGVDIYNSTLECDSLLFSNKLSYTSKDFYDDDTYEETLELKNALHEVSPIFVSVPLLLEFGKTPAEEVGFYVDMGIRFSYCFSDGYSADGTYSAQGKYGPKLGNVVISNVPELGLFHEMPLGEDYRIVTVVVDEKEEKKRQPIVEEFGKVNMSLQGGIGATIPVGDMLLLKVGAIIHFGLNDISGNTGGVMGIITRRSEFVNNPYVTGEGETSTMYFGLELGLYLNKRLK